MRKLALRSIVYIIAIYIAALVLTSVRFDNSLAPVIAGIVLALLSFTLRPLLVIIALPINFLTLGLFTLVINSWMVMLTGKITPGLHIGGFWAAFLIALIVSAAKLIFDKLYAENKIHVN